MRELYQSLSETERRIFEQGFTAGLARGKRQRLQELFAVLVLLAMLALALYAGYSPIVEAF